ncbi:alpha/beta-hydrolase [Peniophora sp. CONT]|nr:alpha/beta-hydrolase [Peniophora sp. CONT]
MPTPQLYEELWLEGPSNTKFYTRVYTPPQPTPARAVLIYVHGFCDQISGQYYTDDHTAMAQRGIAVLSYDQRGFGKTALGEGRSPDSAYGNTGGAKDRMRDVEWVVKEASSRFKDLPIFLHGFSMGGALVLDFVSRPSSPPSKEGQALVRGVISSSPLIKLVDGGPPMPLRTLLNWTGKALPNMQWNTPLRAKELSHDPKIAELVLSDPLLEPHGSLQGIGDMLDRASTLYMSSTYGSLIEENAYRVTIS